MLLGRDAELAEIGSLAGRAREGDGGAILIAGEPGIGKTALLAELIERTTDMTVTRARGFEAETGLPYAALSELSAPLLTGVDRLDPNESQALKAALALAPPTTAGDRLRVFAGFASLVAAEAEESPVLLVVDDAHWLDSPSLECLSYLATRLAGTRVGLLAAARTGVESTPLEGVVARTLSLEPLDSSAATALLRSVADDLAPSAVEALLGAAGGNPLAIRELPRRLSEAQRHGEQLIEPAPEPGSALWNALAARIDGLPPTARTAALVAASSIDGTVAAIAETCRELGLGDDALLLGREAGVVEIRDDRVGFSHPLLRGIAQRAPAPAERRRAHAALARHSSPDAGAWHLAAAAIGPDERAAGALEQAGYRAASRGAQGAAAEALERSVALSADEDARARRLFAAALATGLGGGYDRASAMLDPDEELADPVARTQIRHLLAMLTLAGGVRSPAENRELLEADARGVEREDPALAAVMLSDAALMCVAGAYLADALELSGAAVACLPRRAHDQAVCQVFSMRGMALALAGRAAEAAPELDRAARLIDSVDPLTPGAQSIAFALHARLATGQEDRLREEIPTIIRRGRELGAVGLLPYYLMVAGDTAFRLGDWQTAFAEADEAVAIADATSTQGPLTIALAVRGRLEAARGDDAASRSDLDRAATVAGELGLGATVLWARAALGFLELSSGRIEAAIEVLEETRGLAAAAGLENPLMIPWAPDLVEAYTRSGRTEEARRAAADLARRCRANGTPLALALADRALGIAHADEARLDAAVAHHEGARQPFEQARSLLAHGSWLHRARRRVDAREQLRAARDLFDRLGARAWAERARAELEAAGAVERAPDSDPDELTAQEERIAREVASGATNKEVAAALFLSPKTVEYHLSSVYRKLGIRSRAELAALPRFAAAPDPAGRGT